MCFTAGLLVRSRPQASRFIPSSRLVKGRSETLENRCWHHRESHYVFLHLDAAKSYKVSLWSHLRAHLIHHLNLIVKRNYAVFANTSQHGTLSSPTPRPQSGFSSAVNYIILFGWQPVCARLSSQAKNHHLLWSAEHIIKMFLRPAELRVCVMEKHQANWTWSNNNRLTVSVSF